MVDIIPKLTDEEYADIGKFIMNNCAYGVNVNMNDTFFFACADSERIGLHDLIDVVKSYKTYGRAGLDAFVISKRQEQDPEFQHGGCIRPYYSQDYWDKLAKAKAEWDLYEVYSGAGKDGSRFDEG